MKRIMNWLGKGGNAAEAVEEAPPGIALDVVAEFLRHFPVGARLHYFPEYQRSIKLDTIVLGYEINGQRVFVLKFLQGRNPEWVGRLFFARYSETAAWLDELEPAFGQRRFFYEAELERIEAEHEARMLP